jgi:hypothetical protein
MIHKKKLFGFITLFLLIMAQCKAPDNYPGELDKLVSDASLIFKAKIVLLHTVTTDEDDISNSGVVIVTDVIEAPESFKNISGQQVTVRFSDISKVKVGEERMFFTEPYWIGESLGVTEKGSVLKGDKLYESKEISSYIAQALNKQDDEQLRKYLKDSKFVITGKVVKINNPEDYKRMATEHDPEWREAEIQIDETIKGKTGSKTVKILFASSKDVMFFQSPKFNMGDEGIFIIQQTDSKTVDILKNNNMLIDKAGFIKGKEKVKHIRSLIN